MSHWRDQMPSIRRVQAPTRTLRIWVWIWMIVMAGAASGLLIRCWIRELP